MSNPFLQPGECHIDLPDSECGVFNDKISYSSPNYTCDVCTAVIGTDTDIEGDTDSDYQPGETDGTDGEGEDDEAGDSSPVSPLDVDDTPEETMERNTQIQLREIIVELEESDLPTDFFTSFFIENFEDIVHFYMLFTKYGPFTVIDRPDKKKDAIIETSCAFMMIERKLTRFKILSDATGLNETALISRALFLIETYKGEDFGKGAYLIPTYRRALGKIPSSFDEPMSRLWLEIDHPQGQLKDRLVAYILAYAELSKIRIPLTLAYDVTLVSRGTLSPKKKRYMEIIQDYLNL